MSDSKVSKRKTEPKGPSKKKNASKEVTSPRKKPSNRKSANIQTLVVDENKKGSHRPASVASPTDIQSFKSKKENDEDYQKFEEDLIKKGQAKLEENEKKIHKKNNGKSPRNTEYKSSKKNEEKETEREKKKPDLSESYSETQDSLASILSSLDRDKELVVPSFLTKLSKLLKEPTFAEEFIRAEGFEKLSLQLVKINDTESMLSILSFLEMAFRDCPGVFEQVFTKSAVMVTTLIWLLVNVKKSDSVVTAKVYLLLASLPSIALAKEFPEIEIHNLIFSALNLYHQKADERLRFQNLVKALQTNSKELKLAILNLINAVIEMYQSVEGRIGIRLEFIALGLEALIKTSDELIPEIRDEISRYENLRDKDTESYKQLHANLISPAWIEGKDLQSLAHTLTTRWASLPNQQSVVVATLCSLLHIPNDEIVGTSKWLFLNKVVSQVVYDAQEKLNLEGCGKIDLKPVLHGITVAEVGAKKELEEEKQRSIVQAERIRSLEVQIRQIMDNSSSDQNSEIEIMKKNLEETTVKFSEMEKKLNTETDNANQLQKNYQELQNKFEILEKQDQENLTNIKLLQQKLEEQEKILQAKRTVTLAEDNPSTTATSTVAVSSPSNQTSTTTTPSYQTPTTTTPSYQTSSTLVESSPLTDYPSGINLGKEELRMNRAMNKFGGNNVNTQIGLNIPQKAPSRITSPRTMEPPNSSGGETNIPEWKKRQLEKERLDKEKIEREQQKKLETLSSVTSTSGTLYGTVGGSTSSDTSIGPVISFSIQAEATPEIDEEHVVKPGSELSLTEREEMRLAKALSRPRPQRTSHVHT